MNTCSFTSTHPLLNNDEVALLILATLQQDLNGLLQESKTKSFVMEMPCNLNLASGRTWKSLSKYAVFIPSRRAPVSFLARYTVDVLLHEQLFAYPLHAGHLWATNSKV